MSDEEISAGGSRIYRHEAATDGVPEIAHGDGELIDAVSEHVERHIGTVDDVFHELISPTVHLDVLRVSPRDERPWHTLVTCGMSVRPMSAPEPDLAFAELTLALPPDWPVAQEAWEDERHYWPIRLLKFLGRLPHEYDTWLGEGHTIPNDDPPQPYAPGTALCGAVVAPALLVPEGFRVLQRPAGSVRFLGVVALHGAEMDFKLAKGADALYDRLDAADVSELVDPGRPSTVEPRRRRGLFRRR
jgi:hypothetical protein